MVEQRGNKPGVGFPTQWEDQEKYHGGWELNDKPKNPELKLNSKPFADIRQFVFQPSHAHDGVIITEPMDVQLQRSDQLTAR